MLIIYFILFIKGSIVEPGFTTIIFIQLLFFGLLMFLIGILSIYLGFILDEVKKRPTYIIDDEKNKLRIFILPKWFIETFKKILLKTFFYLLLTKKLNLNKK